MNILPSLPSWFQAAMGLLLLTDIVMLAAERQRTCIQILALQGLVLGIMPLAIHPGLNISSIALTLVFLLIKAIILPFLLSRAHGSFPPSPPLPPYMGHGLCVLAGLASFPFSLWLTMVLPEPANPYFLSFFAPAFTTILTGLLIIVTRRKALTQVMGYLVLENGIYLLGVPLAQNDYMWLELSVLLDVFTGIVIMVLAIYHLGKAFDTLDVEQISSLRD